MPRLFLGLELPDDCKRQMLDLACGVQGARWQNENQLHLTLCFLGKVESQQIPPLVAHMENLASEAFSLRIEGVGCFGDPDHPRNLWAGVAPEAPVAALHREVRMRMQACGFAMENRPFRPHVTLARFGRRRSGPVAAFLRRHRALSSPPFMVSAVSLFESTQGREGSHYDVLARFALIQSPTLPA